MNPLLSWIRNQWDRVGAWVCVGAGAVGVLLAWLGASRTAFTVEQIPYIISGGIGGLFLLGLGAMLWISADLRDQWRVMEQIRMSGARWLEEQQAGEETIVLPEDQDAAQSPESLRRQGSPSR